MRRVSRQPMKRICSQHSLGERTHKTGTWYLAAVARLYLAAYQPVNSVGRRLKTGTAYFKRHPGFMI